MRPPGDGILPDIDRLTPSVLERTALAYICSPANPRALSLPSTICSAGSNWRGAMISCGVDESMRDLRPRGAVGGLEACAAGRDSTTSSCFFLRKRSGVPACARVRRRMPADPAERQLINYGASPLPSDPGRLDRAMARRGSRRGGTPTLPRHSTRRGDPGRAIRFRAPGRRILSCRSCDGEAAARGCGRGRHRRLPGLYGPTRTRTASIRASATPRRARSMRNTAAGLRRMQQFVCPDRRCGARARRGMTASAGRGAGMSDFTNQIGRYDPPASARAISCDGD